MSLTAFLPSAFKLRYLIDTRLRLPAMAVCPQCGSPHIALRPGAQVNFGRALVGLALFGPIGGAVGAVTGESQNTITCLDCGVTWSASDIYKVTQFVKSITGQELDLSIESHRTYVAGFIGEVSPYCGKINEARAEGEKLIKGSRNLLFGPFTDLCIFLGVVIGFLIWGFLFKTWAAVVASTIIGLICGVGIDMKLGSSRKKTIEVMREAARQLVADAEDEMKARLVDFSKKNPL